MMKPTNQLRFVNGFEMIMLTEDTGERKPVKILQQWWERPTINVNRNGTGITGEWRDVPLEVGE